MALLVEELTVWDVSFRWAGFDPDRFYLRYPLLVKDNFRLLMLAILEGEIICNTLCLDKRPSNSKADPDYYIRTHIDNVYACIHGQKYNIKLLKWATLDRNWFYEWCVRRAITPPEFWFPPGWKIDYDQPIGGYPGFAMRHEEPKESGVSVSFSFHWPEVDEDQIHIAENDDLKNSSRNRPNQLTKIACQVIAQNIWRTDNNVSIADMVRRPEIQILGGAKPYVYEVVRRWLSEVAPPEVSARVGRRSNKITTQDI
ncbi:MULTISPECIES: hypothetical protein [Methylotenera]|uniref:hypothetical protein n=1 Tax=Methylotenera TaxID=359407 RepID=UPI00036AC225|nr:MULTISPECIES: hypothetical protein [Methylotenera]